MAGNKYVSTSPNSCVGKGSYKKKRSESKDRGVGAAAIAISDLVAELLAFLGRRSTIPKGVGALNSWEGCTIDTGFATLLDELITFFAHFGKSVCKSSEMLNFVKIKLRNSL